MAGGTDPYRIEVRVTCGQVPVDRRRIRAAVRAALRHCRVRSCELSVAVVDDAEMARLNERFRGRRKPTDVLSFDLSDPGVDGCLDGEVVASAQTARRRADAGRRSPEAELLLYIIHGCLHLAGYDDRQPRDGRRMHAAEDLILTHLGYGAVYGEVSP